ncbi:Phosphoribosylformylglycinamidine (FGAM) synthase [Parelusimicrobium proximum]|uniref:phosphoribosylformylglycinamidine synthase subunit PurS n=1 Tax=Parelusimicrobium proximum TaxID=3228953 RepID=UPI003D16D997
MKSFVEVCNKKDYGSAHNGHIKSTLESVGLKGIEYIHSSKIYSIDGEYCKADIKKIADGLLTDSVLEKSSLSPVKESKSYKVEVWIRDSSTDVIGESVRDAIAAMGLKKPESVRVGDAFIIKGSFDESALEAAVKKTFVNEVVNKFVIQKFQ